MDFETKIDENSNKLIKMIKFCQDTATMNEFIGMLNNDDLFVSKRHDYIERLKGTFVGHAEHEFTTLVAGRVELIKKSNEPIAMVSMDLAKLRELYSTMAISKRHSEQAVERLTTENAQLRRDNADFEQILIMLGRAGLMHGSIVDSVEALIKPKSS